MILKGQIVESNSGTYKVKTDIETYQAKPLGIFRLDKEKPVVGDIVELKVNNQVETNNLNSITKIFPRKNYFIRPNTANLDYGIIVASLTSPRFDDYLLDKMISIFQIAEIEPIIIFTKKDLLKKEEEKKILEIINEYKNANYCVYLSSKEKFNDKNEFIKKISDKFSVITGQTGSGKSTFINNIDSKIAQETNTISKALGRGKHTTRIIKAFEIKSNTFLIDTPGFSKIELTLEEKEMLNHNFFNFGKFFNKCKFNNCTHTNEKGCFVKENCSKRTYDNYLKLINE